MNIHSVACEFQMGGPTDTTQLMAVLCILFFNKPKDSKRVILCVLYVFGLWFLRVRPKYLENGSITGEYTYSLHGAESFLRS